MTIADIARRTGVSVSLVSFVLTGRKDVAAETRQRILDAIRETGYRPNSHARSLATRRAEAMAIAFEVRGYQDAFVLHFLAALGQRLSEHRQRLVLVSPRSSQDLLSLALERSVDAILVMDVKRPDRRVELLRKHDVPVVLFGQPHPEGGFAVDVDYAQAAALVANRLRERGHVRAGLVGGPESYGYIRDRVQAWRTALRAAGLVVAGRWSTGLSEAAGRSAAVEALARVPRPDALVAVTDALAIGAEHGALELGLRIPEDVAVVGFGDIPSAAWAPVPLSTVHVPIEEMGAAAADLLLEAARRDPPRAQLFPTQFVNRASV